LPEKKQNRFIHVWDVLRNAVLVEQTIVQVVVSPVMYARTNYVPIHTTLNVSNVQKFYVGDVIAMTSTIVVLVKKVYVMDVE